MRADVQQEDTEMKKHIECKNLVPGCPFTASADSEEELVKQVAAHAAHAHGITDVTPELAEKVKSAIRTEAAAR
jgi:predicted small metal-binding protein